MSCTHPIYISHPQGCSGGLGAASAALAAVQMPCALLGVCVATTVVALVNPKPCSALP